MAGDTRQMPVVDELSRPHWEAAREGRLLIQRCRSCGRHQFYPRPHCVHCSARDPEWVEAKGTGRLHTFSVVHRTADPAFADRVPYVFGVVELDEGPRILANLAGTRPEELRCDLPVRIVFARMTDEISLPDATPEDR
jgi:uncharacterized protein